MVGEILIADGDDPGRVAMDGEPAFFVPGGKERIGFGGREAGCAIDFDDDEEFNDDDFDFDDDDL